jgi:hypothetical protein
MVAKMDEHTVTVHLLAHAHVVLDGQNAVQLIVETNHGIDCRAKVLW